MSLLSSLSPSLSVLATAIPWVVVVGAVIAGLGVLKARTPQPARVRAPRDPRHGRR